MNIATIIENKFGHNQSQHRVLSEDRSLGILSSGYIKKDKSFGSHIDYETNQYDGLLILSGEGIYKDNDNTEIKLKPGDFVQRFPNHKHSTIITSDNWSELFICVGTSIYSTLAEINVVSSDKPVLSPGLDFELIQQLVNFYYKLGKANRIELSLLVTDAVAILSRANYLDRLHAPTTNEMNILALSTNYIEENKNIRLTVEDVAKHVNMGYEKFRKLFTKHYGISPGNYIMHRRIHAAQKLLSNNLLTVKEIAAELGYPDAYTFSKQFKKVTNKTPTEFRQLYY